LYRLHREWERAESDYAHAARLAPGLSEVEFARGRMLFESGRARDAKAVLDRFLAREPAHVEALVTRAEVRDVLGDGSGSADDYTRAIAASAQAEPDLYIARARVLASLGASGGERALAGLEEGMAKLGPIVSLELCALDVEQILGRTDAALARVDRLAAASPRKETLLARRGEILERAGRLSEARDAYAAALDAIAAVPSYRRTRDLVALETQVRTALGRVQQDHGTAR
jgi:tetratricopeptide (TPR) repeat protein